MGVVWKGFLFILCTSMSWPSFSSPPHLISPLAPTEIIETPLLASFSYHGKQACEARTMRRGSLENCVTIGPSLHSMACTGYREDFGFTLRNPHAVKPPDHYIEYMRLNGWLDVDLDDPYLAHLFK